MSRNGSDQRPFSFRQFTLNHHESTMKVGMDAIILGIWTRVSKHANVLDIGTGSGIIALLLATRGAKSIVAIDIDKPSVEESNQNFANSTWASQMNAQNKSLQEFVLSAQNKYDLIISNPPFFLDGVLSASERQNYARHAKALTYRDLVEGVSKLLSEKGIFSVVLPYKTAQDFITIANEYKLYLNRKMIIFPRRGMTPNRINMEFSWIVYDNPLLEMLSIREENSEFSNEYLQLTNEYYL